MFIQPEQWRKRWTTFEITFKDDTVPTMKGQHKSVQNNPGTTPLCLGKCKSWKTPEITSIFIIDVIFVGKNATTVITSNVKEGPYITIDYVERVSSNMVGMTGIAHVMTLGLR